MSTRAAMLDSAIELFRQRGVAATSLRDVVTHAGASRGSIYHHFPGGKAELAAEATTRAASFLEALLGDLLDRGDSAAAVESFVRYWTRELTHSDFGRGCPVAAAALADEESSAARDAAGVAFGQWQELLAAALVARGSAPAAAADRAALAICAVEGALLVARARRSAEPLAQVGRQLQSLLAAD